MSEIPKPENEEARLLALKALALMDTPAEERFDRYTRFAQRLFDVPTAFVSLIDADRQWFKSRQGLNIEGSPRELSFCAFTIMSDEVMVVADTQLDSRFNEHPLVKSEPYLRFYAGIPLRSASGLNVGTLCITDYKPRHLSDVDLQLLKDLGGMLEQEFVSQALATTDELTGLSNRRGFLTIANQALAMCRRLDRAATLMFFDLDGFKTINDTYGHAEGDQVLRDLGMLMLHEFRNSDVVARLGGDEFCVLLTGTNTEHVHRPLHNLSVALDEESRDRPYSINYSVGTVPFEVSKHKSVEDLLKYADASMYREKKARKQHQDG